MKRKCITCGSKLTKSYEHNYRPYCSQKCSCARSERCHVLSKVTRIWGEAFNRMIPHVNKQCFGHSFMGELLWFIWWIFCACRCAGKLKNEGFLLVEKQISCVRQWAQTVSVGTGENEDCGRLCECSWINKKENEVNYDELGRFYAPQTVCVPPLSLLTWLNNQNWIPFIMGWKLSD